MSRAALAALALALAACHSGKWREADLRLQQASAAARRGGFEPLSGPYNTFGVFNDSAAKVWSVRLDSATTYAVAAACTAGCGPLALALRGPGASRLGADSSAADTAMLMVRSAASGTYTVDVSARCRGRCWWVAQVYARGADDRLRPGYAGGGLH